jgi:hypothetical protein
MKMRLLVPLFFGAAVCAIACAGNTDDGTPTTAVVDEDSGTQASPDTGAAKPTTPAPTTPPNDAGVRIVDAGAQDVAVPPTQTMTITIDGTAMTVTNVKTGKCSDNGSGCIDGSKSSSYYVKASFTGPDYDKGDDPHVIITAAVVRNGCKDGDAIEASLPGHGTFFGGDDFTPDNDGDACGLSVTQVPSGTTGTFVVNYSGTMSTNDFLFPAKKDMSVSFTVSSSAW